MHLCQLAIIGAANQPVAAFRRRIRATLGGRVPTHGWYVCLDM